MTIHYSPAMATPLEPLASEFGYCGHEECGQQCENRAEAICSNPHCAQACCEEHYTCPNGVLCFSCTAEVFKAEQFLMREVAA